MKQDMIVILDLGCTENTATARAIRALGVYSEIYPHDVTPEELAALPNVKGVILNGGPNRVVDGVSIDAAPEIYACGLPEDLAFELVEPLRQLFKDEVRACGVALGLPDSMVYRQPFPGPGLGVRCLGAITRDRLEAVRESDAILREEFHNAGLDKKVWQYFTVVPDFKSVGVRDNARSFEYPVILRAINTVDAMTAEIERIDWAVLETITKRILSEVAGVNRVLYDISPKPPATIEWE